MPPTRPFSHATANSRLEEAATELKLALTELEALSRLNGSSDCKPIAVFVPPVGPSRDLTFVVEPGNLQAAMTRLADIKPASLPSATTSRSRTHTRTVSRWTSKTCRR